MDGQVALHLKWQCSGQTPVAPPLAPPILLRLHAVHRGSGTRRGGGGGGGGGGGAHPILGGLRVAALHAAHTRFSHPWASILEAGLR